MLSVIYAECRKKTIMLSVVLLSFVMLSVVVRQKFMGSEVNPVNIISI